MMHDFLFWFFFCGTIGSGFLFLRCKNPVHVLLCFLVLTTQIAFFLMLLDAFFIALLFLIFYSSLSIVLLMFHLMTQNHRSKIVQSLPKEYKRVSIALCLFFGAQLFFILVYKKNSLFESSQYKFFSANESPRLLGELFYTEYAFSFLALGVLSLVSLIGVVLILGPKKAKILRQSSLKKIQRDSNSVELKEIYLSTEEKKED